MIRAIDNRITDLHQWVVNFTGKRPMWWGEQCAYLLVVAAGFSAVTEVAPWAAGMPWIKWVMLAVLLMLATVLWSIARAEIAWSYFRKGNTSVWRLLFVLFIVDDITWMVLGNVHPRPGSMLLTIGFACYHYFNLCEDPPPPKRRTSNKLATEGTS